MATVTIRPNSDVYQFSLTLSSGSVAYALIDEATLDTNDYVTCAIFGGQLQVGWTDTGLTNATINKVTFYMVSSTTGIKRIGHRDASGFVSWGNLSHSDGGVWSKEFTTNPRTSSAWTISELDNLVCGFLCDDGDNFSTTPVYQLYAVIDYSTSGATGVPKQFMHYARMRSNQ